MNRLPFDLESDKAELFQKRIGECVIRGGDYDYYYSQTEADRSLIFKFQELANYHQLIYKFRQLLEGRAFFEDCNRKVLHHALRNDDGSPIIRIQTDFYRGERLNCIEFASKVRAGSARSFSGKKFASLVQIGFGGSSVSSELIFEVLSGCCKPIGDTPLNVAFANGADEDRLNRIIEGASLDETLFVIDLRGGFDSNATRLRERIASAILKSHPDADKTSVKNSFVLISPVSKASEVSSYAASFFTDDSISEPYSSFSAGSLFPSAVVFGQDAVDALLKGAKSMDNDSLNGNILENPAMFAALYAFFENHQKEKNMAIVVPFAGELSLLVPLVQHLMMDGNCRNTTMDGETIELDSGQFCFGSEGAGACHSFFSALHRGTFLFSLETIGFRNRKRALDLMISESLALFFGCKKRNFKGRRCNTMLIFKELSPFSLGELIAYYENRAMFESFLYDVDGFADDGYSSMMREIVSELDKNDSTVRRVLSSF